MPKKAIYVSQMAMIFNWIPVIQMHNAVAPVVLYKPVGGREN